MSARVLFVSPHRSDAAAVSQMLGSTGIVCERVSSCREAGIRLSSDPFDAVLAETSLCDGGWKDVLALTQRQELTPPLVLTHHAPEGRLWAEALSLGCYDVLAKPFDTNEVQRIVALACAQVAGRPVLSETRPFKSLSAAL